MQLIMLVMFYHSVFQLIELPANMLSLDNVMPKPEGVPVEMFRIFYIFLSFNYLLQPDQKASNSSIFQLPTVTYFSFHTFLD